MNVDDKVIFKREILGIPKNSQGKVIQLVGDLVRVRVTHYPDCTEHEGFNTPPLDKSNFELGSNC